MNGVFYAKCPAPFHLCFMTKDWWNLKSTLVVHLNNKKISIWDLIFFVRSIWHQSWNLNYGVKLWQKCFMKGIEPFLPCAISKFGFAPIGWWYWYKATFCSFLHPLCSPYSWQVCVVCIRQIVHVVVVAVAVAVAVVVVVVAVVAVFVQQSQPSKIWIVK